MSSVNLFVVKFKNRNPNDPSNKHLAEIYTKGPKFDINLISSDQKVISAHKYVVSMFSGYLKDYIREFKPKGKACVPLSDVSSFVLKQVIDLFYNGHIMVGAEVKPHISKALNFLKVAGVVIQIPGQQPAPPTPKNDSQLMATPTQSLPISNPRMPSQQVMNRDANMMQPQYRSAQPVKRQRAQSMYVERPLQGIPSALPRASEQSYRVGGVSITKTKAAPMSNPVAIGLLQNSQMSISRAQKPIQQQSMPNVDAMIVMKTAEAEIEDSDIGKGSIEPFNGGFNAAA